MNAGGPRHTLIIDALLELEQATQTEIEEWIRDRPDLADILDEEAASREKVNSWVAAYVHRLRKRGIIEVVGTRASRQTALRQAKVFSLARGVCPCCATKIPAKLMNVSGVVDPKGRRK